MIPSGNEDDLLFRFLGDFEVVRRGVVCTPGAPKERQLLALLLMRAGEVVAVPTLVEELWGAAPPRSAVSTTQTYVHQLRRLLGGEIITTRPTGYQMSAAPGRLDAAEFEAAAEAAHCALEQGEPAAAAHQARSALAMWRGRTLGGVAHGQHLRGHLVRLEERRLHVLEVRLQADMERGRHRELVYELRELVELHPLNEWFHGLLIEALRRSGRRGDALEAYQHLRRVLKEELGLDPAPETQALHRGVLGGALTAAG